MGWTKRHRPYTKELLDLPLLPAVFLLLVATANAYEIEESSSSESTEEYEQTDSYPPVEQGRAGVSDVCEEEVQKWMCIDLVNSDSATLSGPRVTDFPTVPEVKYEKLSQTVARVTHVYSEGYELMVPPNATIQVTCSQVKVQSPTFNCSHDYLMINSARFCNNNFPQAPFTFTSGNPGSQESMIVLKTANPQRAAYSCQLQVVRRDPKRVIDLIKHVEYTLDVSGAAYRQETDFVILAPKKSFVVMSCPVFEVSDYWPCKQSYVTIELQRYCHFPTAHKVEIEIPPTGTAAISVKLASSPNDRVQCVLHRIAGKKTACVESPNTPTYVGAPERRAQICINMVASPIVKIVSPFRDEMETDMDMTVRYEVMSVPHMVHYLWCNDFRLDTDCSKERLHWFNYNDRLCGHSRPRDFTYSYGHVEDKATYSLTYRKQRGVRQGHFSCFLYREPQNKGTYTLDLFSKNSATIEKHSTKRIFPHDSQVITYYVLAPPDSEVTVTCETFDIQSGRDCSNSYLKINDRQYCDSNVPGRQRLELTYNYATVVFRDGKDSSNSFKCTFKRGGSTDKCAFEKKLPTTTLTPWETIPTTETSASESASFPEEGVTAAPPGTTLVTPFTEETVPWYTIGYTTPRAPEYSPSVTPEVGETFPETPFPGAVTENPVEATLFPKQQETSPSMPGASIAATTEVELLSKVATPSTGLVPEFSQSVSPPEFPTAPSSAQQETSHTLPPEVPAIPTTSSTTNVAFPSRPVGVSLSETFPSGVPVFPTTEVPLPSGVPSKPDAIVPTISIAATEPEFVAGTQKEVTATSPFGVSVVPTTQVSLPTGVSGRPSFIPSVSMGVSMPETVTSFPTLVTQKGIPETFPSLVPFVPASSVSLPSSTFSPGMPSLTGGPSVSGTLTGSPTFVSHANASTSFPPGLPVMPTTEVSFPSGAAGGPTLVVPPVSVGVSVPEITGTPPSTGQKESTAMMPSGMFTVPTGEISGPSFLPGISTAVAPSFPAGVSIPGVPTMEAPPLSGIPGQPTAIVSTVSGGFSVPGTKPGSSQPLPHEEFTTRVPSSASGAPAMEVSQPSGVQSQPTAIVPSVTVGVSVPEAETSTMPSSPHEEFSTHFPLGPSGTPSTEVPPISGITSQPTVIAPSVTVGVSVPEGEPGSSQTLPHGEITTPIPSGISGVPTTEISPPLDVQSQPTAIVPSLSVGVSVPEGEAGSVPSFPVEEFSTPFPSGPSDIPTTEMPPLSGVPSQLTAIVPSVTAGLSWPETEPGSSQTLPHGKVTTPFQLGPSGLPFTEAQLPSSSPAHPAGMVSSVSPGVSEPGTKPGGSHTLPYMPTTELSIPSGVQGQTTAIVPSLSIGVSVPETHTNSVPAFPHGELTSYPTGAPGQLTAVVPSVSVGVSTPESGANTRPSSSEEKLTTMSPSGPLVTSTEKRTPSGAPGQPPGVVASVSVGASVPESQTITQPSFPLAEFTNTFSTRPSGVPITELPILPTVSGQPTATIPSVSLGVSVPESQSSSTPSFPYSEFSTSFPPGPSSVPTTRLPMPPGGPGQTTAVVPSVSVGVLMPETPTGSQPSYPHGEFTSQRHSAPSVAPTTETMPPGVASQPTVIVPSVSVGVSVPESQTSSPPSSHHFTTTLSPAPPHIPITELPLPSGVPAQPTAIVPSMSVGVSVPEAPTGSQPSYPHREATTPFPSVPTVVPTTETISSGVPGQSTAVVPSVSVGVSVPESQTSRPPSFPYSEFTTEFPPGPSGGPETESQMPSGVPGQPTVVIPSVSVGVSEPKAPTGNEPSYPHGEFTSQFPSGTTVIPTTETMPYGVPGQPTAVVPSVSVGVSVPESQTSRPPSFPYTEFTTALPPGSSGVPATESPMPSGVPGQPTAVVPSVSVGVSVPEAPTGSQPSHSHRETTTPFPSVPTVVPTTETIIPGVPEQPTVVVPSVSVGVSLPESQTSRPPFLPYSEFTTALPPGPSGVPATESPVPPGVPGQPTVVVPSMSVGVSVPEAPAGSQPSYPYREVTTPFPSVPSVVPTTETISSGAPGQPTAVVPSVSVGVSVPESQTSIPPSFPYSEFTTEFPPGPSGVPATESPMPSGVPGQPTAVVPSVSVGVSVPEAPSGRQPSYYPHEESTSQLPSIPSLVPTTETIIPGVPGQPTVVIPSVSVGVSLPESQTSRPPSFPYTEFTTALPPAPSGIPATESPMPSGVPRQPTAVVPSVSVGVSVPEAPTGSQPSYSHRETTTPFPSVPTVVPTTETIIPGVPEQPTVVVPSVSVGVSLPESQTSRPPFLPYSEFTTALPPGPSGVPATESPMPPGVPGQPTAVVPSMSVGVSVPEAPAGSQPSYPYREVTTPFPSVPSVVPTTETISSGAPGQPTAVVSSVSVGVSVPESQTSIPPSFPYSEFTTEFPPGPSGVPATESPMPSGVPAQPTAVVPSVSVGVSVPEAPTGSQPSYPYREVTTPFPSVPSVVPTTETISSGATGQPTAVVPSVSVGVSVPEPQTSIPPSFPYSEFTTEFPPGPSSVPATESPMPSGVPGQPTAVVPSVSVGVPVTEAPSGSQPSYYPHEESTSQLPSIPSLVPTTETIIPGVPGQPTVVIPSVSVGVSLPESQTSRPPSFPYTEFTTVLPPGPSGIPATESPMSSGVPAQPTAIVPAMSVRVSVPEAPTGSQPSYPHRETTTPFPSVPAVVPTTETISSGVPGQPTVVVPSVSVSVSVPESPTTSPQSFPNSELKTELPPGPSGVSATESSMPSGIPGQPTVVVPSGSVGVSLPETPTASQPSYPQGEFTTQFPSAPSVVPNTETIPAGVSGQPAIVVPSVSVGVSVPESQTNGPPFSSPSEFTASFSPGVSSAVTPQVPPSETPGQLMFPSSVSSFPTTEASLPSEASGEPSTVSPFASLGVSVPEGGTQPTLPAEEESGTTTQYFGAPSSAPFQPSIAAPSMSATVSVSQFAASLPSFTPVTGTLPSAMTVIPTSEVSLPRGVPGEPTAIVPSSSVGVFLSSPSLSPAEISSHFPPGGSAVSTTEVSLPFGVTSFQGVPVPSYSVGVSVPEVATSTAVPLTVETRTLPSGSMASETVPKTPAQMPSTFPHGTPVVLTTLPSVSMGPYVPRGTLPTSSVGVNVETEKTPPSFASVELSTNVGFPSGLLPTSVVAVSEATVGVSVPSTFVPTVATPTTPSFHGTKVANTFTSTRVPHQTGPEKPISTTPTFITPETEDIWALLVIIRTDLKTYKVNATVLHTLLIKATTIGSHDAYTIILLALKDLKVTCKYLAPSERIKVAYEVAHYLKSHGTRIAHDVVVKAVGVFLCAVDHKDIITKLLSENTYMISISESVASELSCPDMEHLVHLLYADRNRTKIEESPCAGILCEEVPENVMDTIDMLVDRYFPQKAHEKKWLMLDIAKALNLQPEEDEEGDEMVYYKMGDYDVFLEELREPTISDEEKALLFGKFFAEVRKVAKAERKLRLDDLEEVWKMGGGKLPQPAVRSFIALLKLVHSKRISLKTEERIRLLKLALRCDGHECTKLSSSDIHNLIFALCNVGIRDGFGLPKELKSQVTKFILTLKDSYIDSISIRRWKRSSSLLKPRSHDYLSASSPSELRYLKDWLQKPMAIAQKKGLLKNTGRSNDDLSGSKGSALSQLYNAYVNEKRPDIKTVLAERLLDTYNDSFRHLGSEIEDTKKFVLTVVQQLPLTSSRHNDLVLGILEQCIRRGSPCLNISSSESIAPLKVILQNMSLKQSPNFVPNLIHQLFAAAKKARTHVDLSWLTNNGSARRTFQTRVPHLLETPSRAYRLS